MAPRLFDVSLGPVHPLLPRPALLSYAFALSRTRLPWNTESDTTPFRHQISRFSSFVRFFCHDRRLSVGRTAVLIREYGHALNGPFNERDKDRFFLFSSTKRITRGSVRGKNLDLSLSLSDIYFIEIPLNKCKLKCALKFLHHLKLQTQSTCECDITFKSSRVCNTLARLGV